MKINKNGFSIIIGMGLVILITLSAYVILSYILPFSRNVKGIENSSNAYYVSYGGIEKALYYVTKTRNGSLVSETGATVSGGAVSAGYSTLSVANIIPVAGKGNSDFNKDYNIISNNEPLQLEVGRKSHGINSLNWNSVNFVFKVPSISGGLTLAGGNTPMINWILTSEDNTLTATGSYIKANQINNSSNSSVWKIDSKIGTTLNDIDISFSTFYSNNCNGAASGCVLKMSILNVLQLSDNTKIPYLEYKIAFPSNFPNRYTEINSTGKSYGFQKNLSVSVPQQTVNQALDFTVFQ